jgi:hypothetical protein
MLFLTHSSPMPWSSSLLKTLPMGLCLAGSAPWKLETGRKTHGVFKTIILVFGVIAASNCFKSRVHSEAGHTSVSPFFGGCNET